jgi:hypothetical protein
MIDFFISYTHADRPWATWLAWQLEEAGYTTLLDVWDMRPGANFILAMQQATVQAEHTLLVLSPDYLSALFPQPEWAAALAHDPTGRQGTLLPVRVRECTPPGMLRPLLYIDLVGLDEATARDTLLAGVHRERAKPTIAPGFPGSQPRAVPQQPLFPGTVSPPAQTPPQPVRVPIPARVWAWLVRNRQWVWSGIGTALLMALLGYFLTQKPEPTAGRDVNRIDTSGGPAVIQTGKGTIEINQGERKP